MNAGGSSVPGKSIIHGHGKSNRLNSASRTAATVTAVGRERIGRSSLPVVKKHPEHDRKTLPCEGRGRPALLCAPTAPGRGNGPGKGVSGNSVLGAKGGPGASTGWGPFASGGP